MRSKNLPNSANIYEHPRNSAMRRCGNTEAYKYRHGDIEQHGNTEIQIHMRKCGNAEMQKCIRGVQTCINAYVQTTTNICEMSDMSKCQDVGYVKKSSYISGQGVTIGARGCSYEIP